MRITTYLILTIIGLIGFTILDLILPIPSQWRPEVTGGLLRGLGMGIGVWALLQAIAPPANASVPSLPVQRLRFAFWSAVLACAVGIAAMSIQTGVITNSAFDRMPELINPAMIASILCLAILRPTPQQNLFMLSGDERYRLVQLRAQAISFKIITILVMVAICVSYYGPRNIPAPLWLTSLVMVSFTIHAGVLWRLEAREERDLPDEDATADYPA